MKLSAASALLLAVAALASAPAHADKLKVFACEPEWGSLVTELAGDKVDLDVATTALQDVHVIEAKPSLIAKARSADLAVCTGAELEVGWLPQLIRGMVALLSSGSMYMPSRSSTRYSLRNVMPPSLKLPCGAHFQVASAT